MRGDELRGQGAGGRGTGEVPSRAESLDRVVDTAAHAMTRGEPSLRLRHDVRARIGKRPSWRDKRIWIPAMASATALLLIAIAGRGLLEQPEAPRLAPQIATVEPPKSPEPAAPERFERFERFERPSVNPIVIEPIVVPLMAVETSSGPMPIEIDPLQVEPLQPE
jgi:hypothetical protein